MPEKPENRGARSGHVKISAIVHVCEDRFHLDECLSALAECDELIVVDLESRDASPDIARKYTERVVPHKRVPFAELARPYSATLASHDWILFADPDEVFPRPLIDRLRQIAAMADEDVTAITAPFAYYFKSERLACCLWKKISVPRLYHRYRAQFPPYVHAMRDTAGRMIEIPWCEELAVKHYWKDSYRELFLTHANYVRQEGIKLRDRGNRFRVSTMVRSSWDAFCYNFVTMGGWRGGFRGWFLSTFMAGYHAASWAMLLRLRLSGRDETE